MNHHTTSNRQVRNVLNVVIYLAQREAKLIADARWRALFLSFLAALILSVDYMMGLILFDYLDPTLGDVSLGPPFLALSLPIAVIVIHLIIQSDDTHKVEYRLRRIATVGVFMLLFALSAVLALVLYDATDGLGSTDGGGPVTGSVGNQVLLQSGSDRDSGLFAMFDAVFPGLARIAFFAAISLVLFVSVYGVDRLLTKIADNFEHFHDSSKRSRELLEIGAEVDAELIEIDALDAEIGAHAKRLPRDPEKRFAQITSAAISDALHEMKKALHGFGKVKADLEDVILAPTVRPDIEIPDDIESASQGKEVIAHIRQQTTPYAILKNLDCLPPKEEH